MSHLSSSLIKEPYKQAQTLKPLCVEVEKALRCCAGLKIARKRGDGSRRHERTTHDFLAALNTGLYLRNIPLSIVVHRVYLALPEHCERLLRREFSRAKACLRPARHGGDSGGLGAAQGWEMDPPDMGSRRKSAVGSFVEWDKEDAKRWVGGRKSSRSRGAGGADVSRSSRRPDFSLGRDQETQQVGRRGERGGDGNHCLAATRYHSKVPKHHSC